MSRINELTKEQIADIFEKFGVERRADMAEGIVQVEISRLKPHAHNELIYGEEDVSDLVAQIEAIGKIIEPLKIKEDDTIISGHRRWKAAQELKYATIPCEYVSYGSDEEELAALVLYNYGRKKTNEQKAREGMALFETLSIEAVQRRLANLNQNRPDVDNSSMSDSGEVNQDSDTDPKSEKGLTRDKVARAVGISSGKTFARMKEVLERVDELKKSGNTADSELYLAVLNRTPSAARDLLDISLSSLTDADREGIKTGKVAPRKFISESKSTNPAKTVKGTAPYKKASNEIEILNDTLKALNESISHIKDVDERRKIHELLIYTTITLSGLHEILYDTYDYLFCTKEAFISAVSSFTEVVSDGLFNKTQLEYSKHSAESVIESLQALISIIQPKLEEKNEPVESAPATDKKKRNKKSNGE